MPRFAKKYKEVQLKQAQVVGEARLKATITSETDDRSEDKILMDGVDISALKEGNAPLLWSHDLSIPAIGSVVGVEKLDGEIVAEFKFDLEDEFAAEIFRKYKDGILRGFSIGFRPLEEPMQREDKKGLLFTKIEVFEVSAVNVGDNPEALAHTKNLAEAARKDAKVKWAIDILSTTKETNFPEPGDDKKVALQNSQFRRAPLRLAESIRKKHPEEWQNASTEEQKAIYNRLRQVAKNNGVPQTDAQREAIRTREVWAVDNLDRKEPIGVIKQLQMLVRHEEGVDHMKEVLEDLNKSVEARQTKRIDDAVTKERQVTVFQDLPLAPPDQEWSEDEAVQEIRELTDSEDEPSDEYSDGFMVVDVDEPQNFTSYSFPFAREHDGRLKANWNALTTIATIIQGGMGGTDLPEVQVKDLKDHVEQYYSKADADSRFNDRETTPPWAETEEGGKSICKTLDAVTKQGRALTKEREEKLKKARLLIDEVLSSVGSDEGVEAPEFDGTHAMEEKPKETDKPEQKNEGGENGQTEEPNGWTIQDFARAKKQNEGSMESNTFTRKFL